MITDFLPALAHIWTLWIKKRVVNYDRYSDCEFSYSAEDALIGHDAYSEEVDRGGVILSTHDLRRHVSRRPGSVLRVLSAPDARDSEVGDSQIP